MRHTNCTSCNCEVPKRHRCKICKRYRYEDFMVLEKQKYTWIQEKWMCRSCIPKEVKKKRSKK